MLLASAIIPTLSTDLPLVAGRRRDRAGRAVRAGARVHLAGGDGRRHRLRHARRAPRDADRLSRRAGAADGAVLGLADPEVDLADHHRRDAGAPRAGDLSEPRLRRRRLHDDLARRERAGAGRQPRDAPRADDDPRGADPRVLGPSPGADRVGGEPEAVRLFLPRPGAVLSLGRGRGARAARAGAGPAGADPQARRRRRAARGAGDREREDAHLPRARVPRHRVPARRDRRAGPHPARASRADDADEPARHPADQPVRRGDPDAGVRDDLAAPDPFADPPVHAAGRGAGRRDRGGRLRDAPAAPLPVGGPDLRCSR